MDEYFEPLVIISKKICDLRKSQSKYFDILSEKDRRTIVDVLYKFDIERIYNNKDLLYNSENETYKSRFYFKLLDIFSDRNTLLIETFEEVLGINALTKKY